MSKPIMIAIAAVVGLIVLGASAFFVMNSSDKNSDSDSNTESSNSPANKSTIASLLGMGSNVTCSVNYEQGSGTVYIAGDKMRGDFQVQNADQNYTGYVIQDGEYSYTWTSQSNQGTKFKTSEVEAGETKEKSGVDLEREGDVDCSNWSVDNSKFTPPSDVTFTDISETLNQLNEQSNQVKEVCEQLTDPAAKAACLEATN